MKRIFDKLQNWIFLFLLIIMLVPLVYITYEDIEYFITKVETTAEVVKENVSSVKEDCYIDVEYFDNYQNKYVVSRIMEISPTSFNEKDIAYSNRIQVFYSKAHNMVYAKGVNERKVGATILNSITLPILSFGLFIAIRGVRRRQSG